MKVDFNFGATAEIILTPESPREESLVKMCYETHNYPVVARNGGSIVKIVFRPGLTAQEIVTQTAMELEK